MPYHIWLAECVGSHAVPFSQFFLFVHELAPPVDVYRAERAASFATVQLGSVKAKAQSLFQSLVMMRGMAVVYSSRGRSEVKVVLAWDLNRQKL